METCPMCTKWNDEPGLRIAELDMCYVMLNRDQFFHGYTFVITKKHVKELFHLDKKTRETVMEEVNRVAEALYNLFQPDKINYELLGSMVPHAFIVPVTRMTLYGPAPLGEPHPERTLTATEYTACRTDREQLKAQGEQTSWTI
jgi:diadenosine tetraphosphate (Ap4A) HIT family hydrolase